MNKRPLNSFTMCWLFGSFFLSTNHGRRSASPPLMHTWLIESEVFSCPCQLVPIERIKEKQPSHFHNSAYYYSLLIFACHYSWPLAGKPHLLLPQPDKCMRVSYFLVTIYIYIYIYTYMIVCVCVYVRVYIYIYIYIFKIFPCY